MKKSLLLVVFLLAMSSVMAAMSFSSAAFTGEMKFTVKNTNESLLALEANKDHNASGYNDKGELSINLDKGNGNKEFGVQQDSIYTWDKLFTVRNNSEHPINVTLEADKNYTANSLSAKQEADFASKVVRNKESELYVMNGFLSNKVTFKLAPGEARDINLALYNLGNSNKTNNMDIFVVAERADKAK